jgi:hypothetical protein
MLGVKVYQLNIAEATGNHYLCPVKPALRSNPTESIVKKRTQHYDLSCVQGPRKIRPGGS